MSRTSILVRRSVTVLAVALAIGTGLLAIRVAAAWSAEHAPLDVAPVSIDALRAQLADEQGRSSALIAELRRLDAEASELSLALDSARERISADDDHADELQNDLDAARQKLKKLERAIAAARAQLARQPATVTVTTVNRSADRNGEHEGDDEDEDDEHEDDD